METPLAHLKARKLEIEAILPSMRNTVSKPAPQQPAELKRAAKIKFSREKERPKKGTQREEPQKASDKRAPKAGDTPSKVMLGAEATLLAAQRNLQQEDHIEELQSEINMLRDQLTKSTLPSHQALNLTEDSTPDGPTANVQKPNGNMSVAKGTVGVIPDKTNKLAGRTHRFVDSHKRGRQGEGGLRGTYAVNKMRIGQRVITSLTAPANPGDRLIHVHSNDGFVYGNKVQVGAGEVAETRFVVGFGSLLLDRPLDLPHDLGEEVCIVKAGDGESHAFEQQQVQFFMRHGILGSIIDTAVLLGQAVVANRREQTAFERRAVDKYLYVTPMPVFTRHLVDRVTAIVDGGSLCFLPALGRMVVSVSSTKQPQVLQERTMEAALQAVFSKVDRASKGVAPAHRLLSHLRKDLNFRALECARFPVCGGRTTTFSDSLVALERYGDRRITEHEFLTLCMTAQAKTPQREFDYAWRKELWARSLTDAEILDSKLAFDAFDVDGSGCISSRDVQVLLWDLDGVVTDNASMQMWVSDANFKREGVSYRNFMHLRSMQAHMKELREHLLSGDRRAGLRRYILTRLRKIHYEVGRWEYCAVEIFEEPVCACFYCMVLPLRYAAYLFLMLFPP
jgi:Ca2+-binding EF-hand superfamily protein